MRKFTRKLLAAILSAAVLVSSILCLPLTASAEDEAVAETSAVVLNDGFEGSADAWTNATLVTDNVRTGSNAMQIGNTDGAVTYRTFEVEANTDYYVSLWTLNGGTTAKYWGIKPYAVDEEGNVDTDLSSGYVSRNDFSTLTSWFSAQKIFNSGENTTLTLIFEGQADCVNYVDDIEVRKTVADKENNLIKNGSFENGLMNWQESGHAPALLDRLVSDGTDGSYSAQTKSNMGYLAQRITVEPNTNYVFKYSYKKTSATNWQSKVAITPTVIGMSNGWNDSASIYVKIISASAADTWYTNTVSFNSGDNEALTIAFRGLYNADTPSMYFDDVQVYKTGLVVNGGLEYGKLGWGAQYNGIGTIEDAKISTTEYHSGTASATATGYSYVSTVFNAKPNTDYVISFWVKSTGTMQFRLSDGATANAGWKSVTAVEGMEEKVISAKSDWTRQVYFFNSGDITTGEIGVIFRDASNTGRFYVDDVEVNENSGIVKNGGLEYGKAYWGARYNGVGDCSQLTTDEAHTGTYSAKATTSYVSTYFNAESNADYILSFWTKGNNGDVGIAEGTYGNTGFPSSDACIYYGSTPVASDWTQVFYKFNTGELTNTNVSILFKTWGTMYIDDVEVIKNPYSGKAILNGDLEAGNYGYDLSENWGGRYFGAGDLDGQGLIVSDQAYSGNYSVKGTNGLGYIATYFTPEANTYYTVTFYAKGGWTELYALNGKYEATALPSSTEALGYMGFGCDEWQKFTLTFWSGDAETISIAFKATSSTDIYIDDVSAEKSTYEQIPAGDLDINGTVGGAEDLTALKQLLMGTIESVEGKADIGGNGTIDVIDLIQLKKLAADA